MYTYKATVTSVYDGDTFNATVDLGFNISVNETFRIFGLNAPEVRGTEKELGKISRDRLRERILNREITIKTYKDSKEKYGRYLAEIFIGEESINEWLIVEKLAERKDY